MNTQLKKIFIAAPSDVKVEFGIAQKVISILNAVYGNILNIRFEMDRGKNASPCIGNPQEKILQQYKMTDYDYFIGILHTRFGSPTNSINKNNGSEFQSGTQQEFYDAYDSFKKYGKPEILIYHSQKKVSPGVYQVKEVQDFLNLLYAHGEHPALYSTFRTSSEFESLLIKHLAYHIQEKEKTKIIQDDSLLKKATNNGLKNIYLDLDNKVNDDCSHRNKLKQNLFSTSKTVFLMAFTGYSFLALHGNIFRKDLLSFLNNGGKIKIILTDPKGDIAKRIAYAEANIQYNTEKININYSYIKSYEDCIEQFIELKKTYGEQIQLKLSNDILTATILMSENECFFEPYLYFFQDKHKVKTFEIVVDNKSKLYLHMHELFQTYWEHSKTI